LVNENEDKRIAVFWDNASIHKAASVQRFMLDNNILQIMNVPYCPEFNAIELYWARAKKLFRSKITDIKIKGE
jgi:transposase